MIKVKNKFSWYGLPEELRQKLINQSEGFYILKDQGEWFYPIKGYEPESIAILRTYNSLSYDLFIPTIINMMRDGVLTAVFPIGMKVMDVVFYQFDKENIFHNSAYYRARLEMEE